MEPSAGILQQLLSHKGHLSSGGGAHVTGAAHLRRGLTFPQQHLLIKRAMAGLQSWAGVGSFLWSGCQGG